MEEDRTDRSGVHRSIWCMQNLVIQDPILRKHSSLTRKPAIMRLEPSYPKVIWEQIGQ